MSPIRLAVILALGLSLAATASAQDPHPIDTCPDLVEYRMGPQAGEPCIDPAGHPGIWLDVDKWRIHRTESLLGIFGNLDLPECKVSGEAFIENIKFCAALPVFEEFEFESPSCSNL